MLALRAPRMVSPFGVSGEDALEALSPAADTRAFRGPFHTLEKMSEHALGDHGERSQLVRQFTESVVRDVHPKDYLGEILAIRNLFVQPSPMRPGSALFRYTNDPRHVELVKTPERLVREILTFGSTLCDCFPKGTLVLRDDMTLVPIEEVRVGMRIWGLDKWSTVKAHAFKGTLPVDVVRLNNGSQLKLTADHHVLVGMCTHARKGKNKGKICRCQRQERVFERVRVSDLEPGMVLPTPDRLPFGAATGDAGRAYIEGLYVSDGWSSSNSEFNISGQDGCPKEAQKREVRDICDRLGIGTTWYRKSISVKDRDWALRMHEMGTHAPNKHLLSLDLGEAMAAETLRGVMADSGANTRGLGRTFTTTSRELMLQVRVLQKMFGVTCGWSYIENHGGLGENPIWRLSTRGKPAGKIEKILRVKERYAAVFDAPCYDIETDDHHVYLPEHDVTVQNCDESAQMAGTMCIIIGREVEFVAMGFSPRELSHVAVRVKEPKSSAWIVLDGVAGPREKEASQKAQEVLAWAPRQNRAVLKWSLD